MKALDPTFGRETYGPYAVNIYGIIRGSWFTCPEKGVAESLTVYIDPFGTVKVKVKCAIYRKSDNSLVGVTEEKTISGEARWEAFNFLTPKPNLENIDYWLVVWADASCNLHVDVGATGKMGSQIITYDAYPDPWVPRLSDYEVCIYCTYTVGVPPPPTHTLTVESTPIPVPVTLNGSPIGNTPVSATVEEGTHTVEVEPEVTT